MAVAYHLGNFPPRELDLARLFPLVGPANAAVARYEGVLAGIPNPDVLLSPLISQEAVLSSRIEGTQATLGEVLEYEAACAIDDESTPKKADIREVLNYRAALREGTRLMTEIPLSQRLVKGTHRVLMDGVRGRNKDPGEYRRIPNWIGPEGCTIEQARFVPCGADALEHAMDAWETYIHADAPDRLVQMAIVHAEFEAIHPFLDGNGRLGRLGRLIIPLFLSWHELLSRPISIFRSIWRPTGTNITTGCWRYRAMATGRDGSSSSYAASSRKPNRTAARRWRSSGCIRNGGTGSSERPVCNMRYAHSIGCSFGRSSARPISCNPPTFPALQRGGSCVPCAGRAC